MRMHRKDLGWLVLLAALAVPLAAAAQESAAPGPGGCAGCGRMGGPGDGRMGGPGDGRMGGPGDGRMGGPGDGRMGGPGARAFDPASVTTIQGEIVDVQRVARGRHEGVHLAVATGSEQVAVHLGPGSYVDAQALKLAKGDQVEVKGARTTLDGATVVIAQEVRRGGEVLALRDANGLPIWRGQGMRGR